MWDAPVQLWWTSLDQWQPLNTPYQFILCCPTIQISFWIKLLQLNFILSSIRNLAYKPLHNFPTTFQHYLEFRSVIFYCSWHPSSCILTLLLGFPSRLLSSSYQGLFLSLPLTFKVQFLQLPLVCQWKRAFLPIKPLSFRLFSVSQLLASTLIAWILFGPFCFMFPAWYSSALYACLHPPWDKKGPSR